MQYVLAVFAVAIPAVLIVQTIRGRVRPQCCAVPADQDARMRDAGRASSRGARA